MASKNFTRKDLSNKIHQKNVIQLKKYDLNLTGLITDSIFTEIF